MRYGTFLLSIAGLLAAGALASAQTSGPGGLSARTAPIPGSLPHDTAHPTGTLIVARANYPRGSTIAFHFSVKNTTSSAVHYDFSTAQQFDVTVTDPNGVEVWRWSHDRLFAQVLTAFNLKPGEEKNYVAMWDTSTAHALPTGTYTATASLTPSIRPAVRGGLLVNPNVDPNNIGTVTRRSAASGTVVQLNVTPGVSASTKFDISGK